MNKKLGLAVAGALVAFASQANAGISIPAGDWTVDIGGNVNAFYINNNSNDSNTVAGGLANAKGANGSSSSSINTGLLPSWLTVGAKSRQNDLDVTWAVSFQPGASSSHGLQGGGGSEFRQAYFTFGDASWGTVKIGKDLGVFGSDAILNDMTLLGVGSQGIVGAQGGTTTTLGRIGAGFMYADFLGQINYTTPNWNGFQATVGIDQPWQTANLSGVETAAGASYVTYNGTASGTATASVVAGTAATYYSASSTENQKVPAFSGKASYSFSANDVTGKVWAEFKSQKVYGVGNAYTAGVLSSHGTSDTSTVYGVGANAAYQGLTLVGYYYSGQGVGTTGFLSDGYDRNGKQRDSDGGYVQATYALPGVGTKLGVSWGISNLDGNAVDNNTNLVKENEMWTVGVYHPLTKSVNLVAEYSNVKATNNKDQENQSNIVSLGGILFF